MKETIMLVYDNEFILGFIAEFLKHKGFTVYAAVHPDDAELILSGRNSLINFLITDIDLHDSWGRKLHSRLENEHPSIKTLVVSGVNVRALMIGWDDDQEALFMKSLLRRMFQSIRLIGY